VFHINWLKIFSDLSSLAVIKVYQTMIQTEWLDRTGFWGFMHTMLPCWHKLRNLITKDFNFKRQCCTWVKKLNTDCIWSQPRHKRRGLQPAYEKLRTWGIAFRHYIQDVCTSLLHMDIVFISDRSLALVFKCSISVHGNCKPTATNMFSGHQRRISKAIRLYSIDPITNTPD